MSPQDQPSKLLGASEIAEVQRRAARVEPDARERFVECYRVWRSEWFTGPALASSNTRDNRKLKSYEPLVALGPSILPLVAEALVEEDGFPALVLFDELALQTDKAVVVDEAFSPDGEKSRARRTLRAYLSR